MSHGIYISSSRTHFMKQEVLSRVQAKYLNKGYFLSIRPEIKYPKGKENVIADALSRSLQGINAISYASIEAEELEEWHNEYAEDIQTKPIMEALRKGEV